MTHPVSEVRDTTLQLRDLLTASRTRSLSVFDLSPIGYVLMNADGTIRTMNLTLATMLGHLRADLEGHPLALSVVSKERPRFQQHMADAAGAASGEPVACDISLLGNGDIGVLPVHLLTRAIGGPGNEAPQFITAVIDQRIQHETIAALEASGVQLRREARALELRRIEAERANVTLRGLAREVNKAEQRERQRIARLLHDDLQQLLVSAKMRLGMAQSGGGQAEQVEEVGHLIDAAINSSRSLTAQISPPVLHDAGLAAGLRWLARFVEEQHGLEVGLKVELGLEPMDFSDRDFLFQAARELLFNIVKHAGVKRAGLRLAVAGDRVAMTVSDAGRGFDATLLDRPLETWGRMGLRTLRERVQLLGGTFAVRTRPEKGTRIHLDLPLSEMKEETRTEVPWPAQARAAAPKRTGLVRVLIADDHRVVREGIQSFLSREDWLEIVGQAADGREAVLMTRDLQPDVVIMDISMPELNGIEATRIIAGENPRVRIIGMSMHQQEDMASAMISAGAERYLTKGGPAEDLIRAVRELGVPAVDPSRPSNGRPGPGRREAGST